MLAIITLNVLIHTLHQYALVIFLLLGYLFIPQTGNYTWYENLWIEFACWTLATSSLVVFVRNSVVFGFLLDCWPQGLAGVVQRVWMVGEGTGCVRVVGAVGVLLGSGYLWMEG